MRPHRPLLFYLRYRIVQEVQSKNGMPHKVATVTQVLYAHNGFSELRKTEDPGVINKPSSLCWATSPLSEPDLPGVILHP